MSTSPQQSTSGPSSAISLDSRSRMISVRLSVEEYEKFRELCYAAGIRSISEMARLAINNFLTNNQTPQAASQNALDARITELEARLHILSGELKRRKTSDNNATTNESV